MIDVNKGLQIQPIRVNDAALGTLAADTALVLDGTFTGNTRSFLVKQLEYRLAIESLSAGDTIIIGLAIGGATVTEIVAALTNVVVDPDDASSPAFSAVRQIVWFETLRILHDNGTGGASGLIINEVISRIGGGKGIPAKEDTGVQLFAYNPATSALTTGALLKGLYILKGVWLND